MPDFWEILVKNKKQNVPTDQPYLEGPSARKTRFLFFMALWIGLQKLLAHMFR